MMGLISETQSGSERTKTYGHRQLCTRTVRGILHDDRQRRTVLTSLAVRRRCRIVERRSCLSERLTGVLAARLTRRWIEMGNLARRALDWDVVHDGANLRSEEVDDRTAVSSKSEAERS